MSVGVCSMYKSCRSAALSISGVWFLSVCVRKKVGQVCEEQSNGDWMSGDAQSRAKGLKMHSSRYALLSMIH